VSKPCRTIVSIPNPFAPPSPWTKETYRLIGDFKTDFDRQRGRGASVCLNDSFLLMASDFLEEQFAGQAHWDRLDIADLFERFQVFATHPGFVSGMISALGAFYCYLGNIGRVRPETHARFRQLALDAVMLGPDIACEWFRAEGVERCETRPTRQRLSDPTRAN
jgi:hypothetical protein